MRRAQIAHAWVGLAQRVLWISCVSDTFPGRHAIKQPVGYFDAISSPRQKWPALPCRLAEKAHTDAHRPET